MAEDKSHEQEIPTEIAELLRGMDEQGMLNLGSEPLTQEELARRVSEFTQRYWPKAMLLGLGDVDVLTLNNWLLMQLRAVPEHGLAPLRGTFMVGRAFEQEQSIARSVSGKRREAMVNVIGGVISIALQFVILWIGLKLWGKRRK